MLVLVASSGAPSLDCAICVGSDEISSRFVSPRVSYALRLLGFEDLKVASLS